MTHDPETAERLAAILTPLITEQSCGEWDDKTINEDVQMFLPPLLAALQEARNAALREAATEARDCWQHGIEPVRYEDHILALIDTPAPPVEPAGDALRELREAAADVLAQVEFEPVKHPQQTRQRERLRAALAAAPAPIQPARKREPRQKEVAWRCRVNEGDDVGEWFFIRDNPPLLRGDYECQPLYAGQQPMATTGAEARWIADCEAGVYDEDMPAPQPDEDEVYDFCLRTYKESGGPTEELRKAVARYKRTHSLQPDADEREAMVAVIRRAGDFTIGEVRPQTIADALLAAGWTHKREEG